MLWRCVLAMRRTNGPRVWKLPPSSTSCAIASRLNSFTRALLALAAWHFGFEEEAGLLAQNLRDGVKIDESPDQSILLTQNGETSPAVMATAHWGESGVFWRWSDGGVEATSFALMALLAIEPESDLIEPVMNWLVKNRRGGHWSNTRDSAIALLALNQYLEMTKELESDLTYEIRVNGHVLAEGQTGSGNWLAGQSNWQVPHEWLLDGGNEVEIRRLSGQGSLYFSAQAEFFSLEEPVPAAGNEIYVRRDYHRLRSVPTLLKGFVEEKMPINDGDSLQSGDRIEVVLTIEGKNDYEYLIFEDLKPAGLEAVQIRSGEALYASEIKAAAVNSDAAEESERLSGKRRWVYQELRDRKMALFIDKLPEGYWEIRYRLRAETPGRISRPARARSCHVCARNPGQRGRNPAYGGGRIERRTSVNYPSFRALFSALRGKHSHWIPRLLCRYV